MASPGFGVRGARRSRRRRREHRVAKGAECGGVWGGVSAPSRLVGMGEYRGLPAAVAFSAYFRPQNASDSKKNMKNMIVTTTFKSDGDKSPSSHTRLRLCIVC